jgi:hypothetical protein
MLEAETYKFINLFYHNEDSRDIPQIYTNSSDDKILKKCYTISRRLRHFGKL